VNLLWMLIAVASFMALMNLSLSPFMSSERSVQRVVMNRKRPPVVALS